MCITVDPLVAGQSAVSQLRSYLTQVEALLGPVPADFPAADFLPQDDDVIVGNARRAWADNILAVTLDIGTPSRVTSHPDLLAGLGVPSHRTVVKEEKVDDELDEPFVEPPPRDERADSQANSASGVAKVTSEPVVRLTAAELCLSAIRGHGVLSSGSLADFPERTVRVISDQRELGTCVVVATPDLATPYTIFSQVSAYLAQFVSVPALPRWMFVGD